MDGNGSQAGEISSEVRSEFMAKSSNLTMKSQNIL